jgi:hypothetical protein
VASAAACSAYSTASLIIKYMSPHEPSRVRFRTSRSLTLVDRVYIAQTRFSLCFTDHIPITQIYHCLTSIHQCGCVLVRQDHKGTRSQDISSYGSACPPRLSVPTAAQRAHRGSVCPPRLSVPTAAQFAHRGSACPPRLSVPTAAQFAHRGSACPPRLSVPTPRFRCAHRGSACPPRLSVPIAAQRAHRGSACPPRLSVPTPRFRCAHRGSACPSRLSVPTACPHPPYRSPWLWERSSMLNEPTTSSASLCGLPPRMSSFSESSLSISASLTSMACFFSWLPRSCALRLRWEVYSPAQLW